MERGGVFSTYHPLINAGFFCAVIGIGMFAIHPVFLGIGVTAGLFVITDYYTSTRFRPVRTTARGKLREYAMRGEIPGIVKASW